MKKYQEQWLQEGKRSNSLMLFKEYVVVQAKHEEHFLSQAGAILRKLFGGALKDFSPEIILE